MRAGVTRRHDATLKSRQQAGDQATDQPQGSSRKRSSAASRQSCSSAAEQEVEHSKTGADHRKGRRGPEAEHPLEDVRSNLV